MLIAIASGLGAFIVSTHLVSSMRSGSPANLLVVGAVRDISIGSVIKREDVDLLPPPENMNPKVLFTDFDRVVGETARRNVPKGEVIRTVDLLAKGDNLASLIPPGYRAMNIPVVLPSNLTNLIQVGNRVDILLTYQKANYEVSSVTLVKNAKVIGVSEPPKGGFSSGANQEMYITLAVTPDGAETLAFAMKKGTLNVAVHSLSDSEAQQQEKFFTLRELFFNKANEPITTVAPAPVEKQEIEVIRGLNKEKYSFENPLEKTTATNEADQ